MYGNINEISLNKFSSIAISQNEIINRNGIHTQLLFVNRQYLKSLNFNTTLHDGSLTHQKCWISQPVLLAVSALFRCCQNGAQQRWS